MNLSKAISIVTVIFASIIGEIIGKGCYYKNTTTIITPYGIYTDTYYRYLACPLSTCCGAPQPGTPKVCCDATGAKIGIAIGCVVFGVIIIGAIFLCRRYKRKGYIVIGNERQTLISQT